MLLTSYTKYRPSLRHEEGLEDALGDEESRLGQDEGDGEGEDGGAHRCCVLPPPHSPGGNISNLPNSSPLYGF